MFYYDSDHRNTDSPPKAKTYKQLIIYHLENTATSEVSVKFQSDGACDYVTTACLSSKSAAEEEEDTPRCLIRAIYVDTPAEGFPAMSALTLYLFTTELQTDLQRVSTPGRGKLKN